MAIYYCDWENGDDTVGDGSLSNPYKTVETACGYAGGGDEIRLAKVTTSDTTLTGTIAFTQNSGTVTGTGTSFTTELSTGDMIKTPDGWAKVTAISSDTSLTIYWVFRGTTTSGYSLIKLAAIDVGTSPVYIVRVTSGGTSDTNRLKISGGWNMASGVQDGVTKYWASGGNSYDGYGITVQNADGAYFVDISKIELYGFYYGLDIYGSSNTSPRDQNWFTDIEVGGCYYSAKGTAYHTKWNFSRVSFGHNGYFEFQSVGEDIDFQNLTIKSTDNFKVYPTYACKKVSYIGSDTNTIRQINISITSNVSQCNVFTADNLKADRIDFANHDGTIVSNITANTVSAYYGRYIINSTCTINTSIIGQYGGSVNMYATVPSSVYAYRGDGLTNGFVVDVPNNKRYVRNGYVQKDTANARSGSCVKMYRASGTGKNVREHFFLQTESGTGYYVKFYIKGDGTYNGIVKADVWQGGEIIASTPNVSYTTTYAQKSIELLPADVADGFVELLIILEKGTSGGSIYIDDISIEGI